MATIKALRGGGRLGRPRATLASSASKEIADQHDQPVPALVLQYVTAKGVLVRLPFKGPLTPGRERIIQPLIDAQSILLNRKSKGYGESVLLATAAFADFLDCLDVQGNGLECIADINSFTGAAYSRWLQARRPGRTDNGKVYSIAERSLQLLRSDRAFNTRSDIGDEPIKWPRGPRREGGNLESLDNATYTGLIRACQKDVEIFRSALAGRNDLDDEAEIIVDTDPSLANLAWLVINECGGTYPLLSKAKDQKSVESARTARYISNALKRRHEMSVDGFRALLETDEGKRLAAIGRPPKNRRAYGVNGHRDGRTDLVLASILKTIRALHPGWPLQWDTKKAMDLFSHNAEGTTHLGHLGHAVMHCPSPITGVRGVSGVLDAMYPQSHVIWSLFIWCRIQTGWNSETMTSIDFDDQSIVDCPLDPDNYALIIGTKKRPAPKQVIHRSNKHDRYGVYSLLQWLRKVTDGNAIARGRRPRMKLTDGQREVIAEALGGFDVLSETAIADIVEAGAANSLSDEALVAFLQAANAAYRAGQPIVDDAVYDHVFRSELESRRPDHPFLHEVEGEVPQGKTVELPARMLSTQKAYTTKELQTWLERVERAANVVGISDLKIKATPKLDGFAAYDDGTRLYSRGDGKRGADITRAFERGLRVGGDGVRGQGAGEIVVNRAYFQLHMSEAFENSRNVQAAILAEKKVDPVIQKAIDDGAALFMPFAQLPHWTLKPSELASQVDSILEQCRETIPFDLDGLVLEAMDPQIKNSMGSARAHHRWQIAYKVNEEGVAAVVVDVIPNTSRLGRVNPVALIEPLRVSGVVISRVTAHHYGMVKSRGIGPGARIKIVRSGLVIPKIVGIVEPAQPKIPTECPSCSESLAWEGDYLFCRNIEGCPAQTSTTLEHFFKTMRNVDGFGPQTIEQLYRYGVRTIGEVYDLTHEKLEGAGFGDKTSENLLSQLDASRRIPVEDSRFLAAFGVARLGEGNAEKLLSRIPLEKIFDASVAEVASIPGFAEITAQAIVSGLADVKAEFETVRAVGFNLTRTPLTILGEAIESPISGKVVVFTGKMQRGRDELEKQAKALGAKVGSSVSSKTWLLVTGQDVGAAKAKAAADNGVEVMNEAQYLHLIAGKNDAPT